MCRVIIKTANKEYKETLAIYAPVIDRVFKKAARLFKCDNERTLRPVYLRPGRTFKDSVNETKYGAFAGANFNDDRGEAWYYISLNMIYYDGRMDKSLHEWLIHEVAHIVEHHLTGQMTHGPVFDEIEKKLKIRWMSK